MFNYTIRRLLYALPVLLGVNFITFVLFFSVNSADDIARAQLGQKYVTQAAVEQWKNIHGYDKPLFVNQDAEHLQKFTDTLFYTKSINLFRFEFGLSDSGRDIASDVLQRMWPSLAIAVPVFLLGLLANIAFALMLTLFRNTIVNQIGLITCVSLMSISALFYIIIGQFIFAKVFQWVPISGYHPGFVAFSFVILPIVIGMLSGLGSGVRWYNILFLEEIKKPYVTTAHAKGLLPGRVMFKHVLGNAMLPILTGVVIVIPSLFLGSLLLESFFAIPGLGSYTIEAISAQDFAIVRVMVFLGALLYMAGLLLTDIAYSFADPRIRLQ